jgi:opacity protein-like surface antigen
MLSLARRIFFSSLALPALVLASMAAWSAASCAQEQAGGPYFARLNSVGFFAGYSNNSRHIFLGLAEQRKLLNLGFTYGRRLTLSPRMAWQYNLEVLPVALEGDPLTKVVVTQLTPQPMNYTFFDGPVVICNTYSDAFTVQLEDGFTYTGTETASCGGHRWTMGEAITPLGFDWNFLPRNRVQPLVNLRAGTMFSKNAIPVIGAGWFNFTFSGGAGVELFSTPRRSIRLEYRLHHISNRNMANENPGIDNGVFQVTYLFGR